MLSASLSQPPQVDHGSTNRGGHHHRKTNHGPPYATAHGRKGDLALSEASPSHTAWSPDGKRVATEIIEKKIVLLDASTGRKVSVLDASQTTVQDAVMAGYVGEGQRIQDIEEVDLIRRHLITAKGRADDAERELKRLRPQLRELKESHEQALARIAALEAEAEQLKGEVESTETKLVEALSRAASSDHALHEAERREKSGGLRIRELEERVAKMEVKHQAEIRQLHTELDVERLKNDVEQTKLDVRRLEGKEERPSSFNRLSSPLAVATSSLSSTLKSLTGYSPVHALAGNRGGGAMTPPSAETDEGPRMVRKESAMSKMGKSMKQFATVGGSTQECKQS